MTTTPLPFSPLTTAELADRARQHALMAVGALEAWSRGLRHDSEPTIAIRHARLVTAYHDAEDQRQAQS
jgi:hypothetical protein